MKKPSFGYLNDSDPWMLAEDIPDIDPFFSQIWLSCFANEFRWPGGKAYKKILTIYKGYHLWFYYGEKDSKEVGDHLVQKFIKNPQFTLKANKEIVQWSDSLRWFARYLPEEHLSELTNDQLWHLYKRHDNIHTQYYQWGWIPVAVDMFHSNLTEKLKQYLGSINVSEDKINEYLVILTTPAKKSLIQIEREEFLKIALKIQNDSYHKKLFQRLFKEFKEHDAARYGLETHSPEYEAAFEKKVSVIKDQIKNRVLKWIEKHYLKYYYVKFLWIGKDGLYTFDYYLKELVRLIGSGSNIEKTLNKEKKEYLGLLEKRKRLLKKLKIQNPWKTLFLTWGDFMVTKIYRRFAQIYAIYRMQPILEEIARRLRISLRQVRFMLKDEVGQALLGKKKTSRKVLQQRTRLCVYYVEREKEQIFVGPQAQRLAAKTEALFKEEVEEIQGQCGCVGKAKGVVKIIIRASDMGKMKKGDILVSIATDPDIVPAMKKAAAIVTEQGGVTSHAAIVARELNIPCVIGTKIATRVLKDGDRVEVDAERGVVKKI